jgi:membrane protein
MKNGWRSVWAFFVAVGRRFVEERAMQTAGSLSYTTLLSLVPLLTVALAVSTAFPVFHGPVEALKNFVFQNFLPEARGLRSVVEMLDAFARNVGRLTAIGLIGFMVTALMLMLTIDTALNRIFRVQRRRSVVQRLFVYWALLTLGPVLVGVSLSMTPFAVERSLGMLVPFVLTCIALTLLYAVVPFRQVELRHAFTGAFFASIAFEAAKRGFALYLSQVPTYRLIYGAFATVPIFLVWLYVSWLVVIAGAVLTAMLPGYVSVLQGPRPPGYRLVEALAVLSQLAEAREAGMRALPARRLARRAHLPPYRCEQVLERAAALGWAVRTERDNWVLARDADTIRVADVQRAYVFDPGALGVGEGDFGLSLREFLTRNNRHAANPAR